MSARMVARCASSGAQKLIARPTPLTAEMATLCIDGGKKAKMRPGDVLGALTGDMGRYPPAPAAS
jgi:hypothetical protein